MMAAEEQMFVDWTLQIMANIGYGHTREQLCATVKEISDKDGHKGPFTDNYQGKFYYPSPHHSTPRADTHTNTHMHKHFHLLFPAILAEIGCMVFSSIILFFL